MTLRVHRGFGCGGFMALIGIGVLVRASHLQFKYYVRGLRMSRIIVLTFVTG